MECKYCKKKFKNKSSLNNHIKYAKYCLNMRNEKCKFQCEYCDKIFSSNYGLSKHLTTSICKKIYIKMDQKINSLNNIINNYKLNFKNIQDQLQNSQEQISCLQKALENCALEAINQQKDKKKANEIRIKYLEKKYLKKQKRIEYKEKNVIYILTTNLMQKERRYIMGKATNLTNRLSTYNKSDEHVVIYFQECPDKETMDIVETVIFQKLKKFREKANRERFILPHDKEITFFQDMIHKCIEFQK